MSGNFLGYFKFLTSNDDDGSPNSDTEINRSLRLPSSTTAEGRHRPEPDSSRIDGSDDTAWVPPEGDALYWIQSPSSATPTQFPLPISSMWSQPSSGWPQSTSSWMSVSGQIQSDSDSIAVAQSGVALYSLDQTRVATNALHSPPPHKGPLPAEENASYSVNMQTRRKDATGYANSFYSTDSIAASPWRHSKSTIKVSPIPLEPFPTTARPPFLDLAAHRILQEASTSLSLVPSPSNGGVRFTGQGFRTITRPLGNDVPPDEPDGAHATGSRPKHRDVDRDDPLCGDPSDSSRLNTSVRSQENGTPTIFGPVQSPCDDPHGTEQAPYHVLVSRSEIRDHEDVGSSCRPGTLEPGRATIPRRLVAITAHPLHSQKETHNPAIALPTLASAEAASPPRQDRPHRTDSPPERTDAVDAFLGVTQTTTRHLDDTLERGMIGAQLEVESGISPWLNINAFGPRTKVLITVLALGVVLLGAVAKLSQEFQSKSSTL